MSKADRYRAQAELCDRHAAAAYSDSRELAELWRSIAGQYRYLESVERRRPDWWLPWERPTEETGGATSVAPPLDDRPAS
jgi:hypothetical protein